MIDARALLVAMLDAVEQDPALQDRVRRVLVPVEPPLVDRDTAAAKANIERRALDAMIEAGTVPARRIGRRVMVALEDVCAAIVAKPAEPVPPQPIAPVVAIDSALRRRLKNQ